MHDPMTVAFEIKYPWRKYGAAGRSEFLRNYRESLITIWHVDPETDGTDDSCGWFARARHGDQDVLERIVKRFQFDWDRTFTSEGSGRTYNVGFFDPDGYPAISPTALTLNLFFLAGLEMFGSRERALRWMQRHLAELLLFAENPSDSLADTLTQKFGADRRREERIRNLAAVVYGYMLRERRPWWRHPRWHVWHWRLQIHPLQQLRRWLFERCGECRKGYRWGYYPVTFSWSGDGPTYHAECSEVVSRRNMREVEP